MGKKAVIPNGKKKKKNIPFGQLQRADFEAYLNICWPDLKKEGTIKRRMIGPET